eukprot:13663377-Alexandrium_andersonii.AAC.1
MVEDSGSPEGQRSSWSAAGSSARPRALHVMPRRRGGVHGPSRSGPRQAVPMDVMPAECAVEDCLNGFKGANAHSHFPATCFLPVADTLFCGA